MQKSVLTIDGLSGQKLLEASKKGGSSNSWMSMQDVADDLGVEKQTVQWWKTHGLGPPWVKISYKCVRIRRSAYHAWLAERAAAHESRKARKKSKRV